MRMISSRARVTTWEPASPSGSSSSRIAGGRRGRLLSTCRSRVFIAQRIVPDGRVDRPAPRAVRCGHAAGDLHRAKLHRSRDDGETWEEVAAPKWPEKPADADERSPTSGAPWPWSLDQIWVLEADPRGADALWCGTIPGGLFHSTDGGGSWRLVRSLWDRPERKQWFGGGYDFPGIHSICVDARDPGRVLAGV